MELIVYSNSVYTMSKTSQSWFQHGLPQPAEGEEVEERFSITLRTIEKPMKRKILLMGDSNTKNVNFGEGSGKVGKSYPGNRIKASKVGNIQPHLCIGYSDLFLMSGTNDLRCEYINDEEQIHSLVLQLKGKLREIRQLCPRIKIFVVPVLPSRIPKMNENIGKYNELVDHMLYTYFPDIWYEGIYSFLDNNGLLSKNLARGEDKIHLGSKGIAKLVRYIKTCVFQREKEVSFLGQESTQWVGSPEPT